MLHMPVDARNLSPALLALFASLALLQWASAVFIAIMLSLLLTMAFAPWLKPCIATIYPLVERGCAADGYVVGLACTAWSLSDGAVQLVDSLPVAAKKTRDTLRTNMGATNPLDTVQKAASQIEQAATDNSTAPPPLRGVSRVVVERSQFNVRDYLWSGTVGLVSALGQLIMMAVKAICDSVEEPPMVAELLKQ